MLTEAKTINNSLFKRTRGNLIVFTGPSGVGKGTVVAKTREDIPELQFSISATTRTIRPGELDGENYFYKSKEEFEEMIRKDELLEWAEFVGNFYGTPRDFVEEQLNQGLDVLLEIEVVGALQVKEKFPEAIMIFLLPPSYEELENRLRSRGTENEETIQKRLAKAKEEMGRTKDFKYYIVNDTVESATRLLESIILAEHARVDKVQTD